MISHSSRFFHDKTIQQSSLNQDIGEPDIVEVDDEESPNHKKFLTMQISKQTESVMETIINPLEGDDEVRNKLNATMQD